MKTRLPALILAVLMLFSTARAAGFADVADTAWYATAVRHMSDRGLFTGYPDGTFGPERDISRGEFVTVLARLLRQEAGASATYWCGATLEMAREDGWTPAKWASEPIDAAHFEVPITREEAVYCLMNTLSPPIERMDVAWEDIKDFRDIDPAFQDMVLSAYNAGVTNGVPGDRFDPKGRLSRAQAAVMLYRVGEPDAYDTPSATATLVETDRWEENGVYYYRYSVAIDANVDIEHWALYLIGDARVEQCWDCSISPTQEGYFLESMSYNAAVAEGSREARAGVTVSGGMLLTDLLELRLPGGILTSVNPGTRYGSTPRT